MMSTKKKVKQRENYRCQICGDYKGKIYFTGGCVETEAHHIIPKSKGGPTQPDNLITLCDLCHSVLHSDKWKYQFCAKGTLEYMEEIKQNFEKYIKLPYEKREKVKEEIWRQFGIS